MVKNLPNSAGNMRWIPGSGRSPGKRKWQLTSTFLPGKSRAQRSLMAYNSPRGGKESLRDMTERLNKSNNNKRITQENF